MKLPVADDVTDDDVDDVTEGSGSCTSMLTSFKRLHINVSRLQSPIEGDFVESEDGPERRTLPIRPPKHERALTELSDELLQTTRS